MNSDLKFCHLWVKSGLESSFYKNDQWLWAEKSKMHTHTLNHTHSTPVSWHSHLRFLHPVLSVDQTGIQTSILPLNESGTMYFLTNYRFLSGLASIISQSVLQVRQLWYYCNHGDLFAVWFAVGMYLWMRVGGGSASVCVCVSVFVLWAVCQWPNQLNTLPTHPYTHTCALTSEL